jgi:hypothetical protein
VALRNQHDGTYGLELGSVERQVLTNLCGELSAALAEGESNPSLRRLFPPAYANDAEHERAYQSLVGDQLVQSRLSALETVERTCQSGVVTVDELGAWLTALNALRLVIGTQLDVGEQHDSHDVDERDPDFHTHVVYDFLTGLLAVVLMELTEQR